MNLRFARIGTTIILLGFLLVFFLPLVPFTKAVTCNAPPGGFYFGCPPIPTGGSYSGYHSIGYLLTGWGASYSGWLGGYVAPAVANGACPGCYLTAFGVLLAVALPLVVAIAVFLSPEIVGLSKVTRIGFIAFGAFVVALSALLLISMIGQGFQLVFALLGAVLVPTGSAMVVYGLFP